MKKNRDKLLQTQNFRYINFKELLRSDVGLKALEENLSEKNQNYMTNETNVYHIDGFKK